jgi:membrane-bound serine protease (ClpP class)
MQVETMTHRRPSPLGIVRAILLLLGALSLVASAVTAQDEEPTSRSVIVLPTTGVVDQIMSEYLRSGIRRAAEQGAAAVVIELDTPGGSLEATREIVQTELSAEVPVMVWVGPAGARAASAGTFLTLAAHVASMAPATNIGAATPVSSDGQDIPEDLNQKILNDTIATITSIAEERGRPVEWAVGTVTEANSYTVDEALEAGAIDIKADSIEDLLAQADGMEVRIAGEPVVLETAGAEQERLAMNPFQAFLHLLSDPNIAFILFTLGFYGIFFELQNPNYVTGIVGAFALILAFIGFGSLPLNIAGLLLIGLAVLLFVLELTVTSGGLLTVGGLVAFALGASALYTEPGDPVAPDVSVSPEIIVIMTLVTGLFMLGVVYAVIRTQRSSHPVIGQSHLTAPLVPLGTAGEVRSPLVPTGTIYARGEEWTARGEPSTRLERGTTVRVTGNDGMVLLVEPMPTRERTEGTA